MRRRGFLGAILAAGAAPAIVRASSLMPIAAPKIIVPWKLPIAGAQGQILTNPDCWIDESFGRHPSLAGYQRMSRMFAQEMKKQNLFLNEALSLRRLV